MFFMNVRILGQIWGKLAASIKDKNSFVGYLKLIM